VSDTDTRLSVHEAVCAERYKGIQDRFDSGAKRPQRIEYLIYVALAAVLLGPGVAATFIKKFFGL